MKLRMLTMLDRTGHRGVRDSIKAPYVLQHDVCMVPMGARFEGRLA